MACWPSEYDASACWSAKSGYKSMRVTERQRTKTGWIRSAGTLLAVVSLFLFQVAVSLTHAPGLSTDASAVALHGHVHSEQADAFAFGHDATDHEHQLTALAAHPVREAFQASRRAPAVRGVDFEEFIADGPRKPPRTA